MKTKLKARAEKRLKQVNKLVGRLKHIDTSLLWPIDIMNRVGNGGFYGHPYIRVIPKTMRDKMKTPQPKRADTEARAAWDKTHAWHQGQLMQKVRTKLLDAGITYYAYRNRPVSQSIIVKVK